MVEVIATDIVFVLMLDMCAVTVNGTQSVTGLQFATDGYSQISQLLLERVLAIIASPE